MDDRRWLAISRRWPHRCQDALPLDRLSAAEQAARLLRRVDQFLSLIGRAVAGQALTVAAAARRACLGHDGVADELGAALLQAVGIYPAGSLVRLHNGEACVVVRRGARANLPLVAALLDRMGLPWPTPPLRDTAMARFALQGSLPTGQLRLKPPCRPPLPSGCH